jgi:lipid-A-disaccharide synthase-like uncharacterized protein
MKWDWWIILGQSAGVFIYARNLYFIHRQRPPRDEKLQEFES